MSDSPKVTKQVSLTTSEGRSWLVVGAILTVLCIALFSGMIRLNPPGAAVAGIITEVVLYLAMIGVRFGVRRKRMRLAILAVLTTLIALTFLIFGGIVTSTEWSAT